MKYGASINKHAGKGCAYEEDAFTDRGSNRSSDRAVLLCFAPDGINKRAALIKMQSVCAAWRTLQIKKLLNRSMGQAIQQLLLLQQTQI